MAEDGPTVLVVDDEQDMRMLVRLVLEASGRNIRVVGEAEDGVGAISAWAALDPPEIPDVVVLDNRMPGKSGLEVAEEMFAVTKEQRIILFSAHLTPEIIDDAAGIGVQKCVSKELVDELPDMIVDLVAAG